MVLAPDEDEDGNLASGNTAEVTKQRGEAGKPSLPVGGPPQTAVRTSRPSAASMDRLKKREMELYNLLVKQEKADVFVVNFSDGGLAREELRVRLMGNGTFDPMLEVDMARWVKALEAYAGPPPELVA